MKIDTGGRTLESMSQAIWYNKWTLKKFEKYLHGDILEVGCGIGNFTKELNKYGKVWAIDISEAYIKQTSALVGRRIGIGDIEKGKYFFKGKQFDCIVCLNVLEHIKDDKKALKNIFNLLKDKGILILLVPIFDFLYGEIDKSIGHLRRYEKNELQKMVKSLGFEIIKSRTINFLGAIGWWISSRILSNNKIDESKIKLFNFIAPLVLRLEDLFEPAVGTSILIIAKKNK